MKSNTKVKRFSIYMLVFVTILTLALPVFAVEAKVESTSLKIEEQLKTIIKEYGEENVVFEDGICMYVNEEISLKEVKNEESITWISKDENILKISNNSLIGISEGTTFLIGKLQGKFYIQEVYVSQNQPDTTIEDIKIENNNTYASQYTVYIDPGHGGSDPGAVGNGLKEKDLTLNIALKVKRLLESSGIRVIMSRETDKYISLQERSSGANISGANAFVSIHINSVTGAPTAKGIETLYYKSKDKPLADLIQPNVISATGAVNRKVKYQNIHVARETIMPASLVECGFISNVEEANKMKDNTYQELLANGIVNGTIQYLEKYVTVEPDIPTPPENIITSERIFGLNRYETSYKVFKNGWTSSDNVVLVSGLDYPDALAAAPLAGKYDAPIILVENKSLNSQENLITLLKDKGVKNAFIVGGNGVIPSIVENELSQLGIASKRLGGKNRYDTSVKIAEEIGTENEVAITVGSGFADGISFSAVAAKRKTPIVLVEKNTIPLEVKNYLNSIDETKTYIIGGEGVVSNEIANSLVNPYRLGGKDRYETNKIIFETFKNDMNLKKVFMASGVTYPDALSASALAAKEGTFVMLSHTSVLSNYTKSMVEENKKSLEHFYILGGESVLSNSILNGLGIKY